MATTKQYELNKAIAGALLQSKVGLFRQEIFTRIDRKLADGLVDRVSAALSIMKNDNLVERSAPIGQLGSRWSITPKGRTAFSILHDDEGNDDVPSEEENIETLAEDVQEIMGKDTFSSSIFISPPEFATIINEAYQEFRKVHAAASAPIHPAPVIEDKEITIAALQKVGAIMAEDIKERLDYVITILKQLPEAA